MLSKMSIELAYNSRRLKPEVNIPVLPYCNGIRIRSKPRFITNSAKKNQHNKKLVSIKFRYYPKQSAIELVSTQSALALHVAVIGI